MRPTSPVPTMFDVYDLFGSVSLPFVLYRKAFPTMFDVYDLFRSVSLPFVLSRRAFLLVTEL